MNQTETYKTKDKNTYKNRKKKSGFTLVEMIIVIAVMAIISAIAVPSYSGIKESVAEKADNESCATIERTVKLVLADKDISVNEADYTIKFYESDGKIASVSGGDANTAKLIKDSLADIKKPQEKNKTSYNISITASSVDVTMGEDTLVSKDTENDEKNSSD